MIDFFSVVSICCWDCWDEGGGSSSGTNVDIMLVFCGIGVSVIFSVTLGVAVIEDGCCRGDDDMGIDVRGGNDSDMWLFFCSFSLDLFSCVLILFRF